MSKKLELTRWEGEVALDCVLDRLVAQKKHVQSREEPSPRALEILDTLQELKVKFGNLAYPGRYIL